MTECECSTCVRVSGGGERREGGPWERCALKLLDALNLVPCSRVSGHYLRASVRCQLPSLHKSPRAMREAGGSSAGRELGVRLVPLMARR